MGAPAMGYVFIARRTRLSPKVQQLYEGIVEEVNQNLARFEKLKRVLLVADEFTATNAHLTPP